MEIERSQCYVFLHFKIHRISKAQCFKNILFYFVAFSWQDMLHSREAEFGTRSQLSLVEQQSSLHWQAARDRADWDYLSMAKISYESFLCWTCGSFCESVVHWDCLQHP